MNSLRSSDSEIYKVVLNIMSKEFQRIHGIRYVSVTTLQQRSHEEISSMFKAAKVPFVVASEAEIANTLRGFTPCQQKATLTMVRQQAW